MARIVYLTEEQYDVLKSLPDDAAILIAPAIADEVRHRTNGASTWPYDLDLDLFDIKAELVKGSDHNFMHSLDDAERIEPETPAQKRQFDIWDALRATETGVS